MPDPTPDQRIDRDRREKWQAFRRKHGMAEDAPFVGKCPWVECYEEALDALNYLEQIKPEWWTIADYVDAQLHARVLAAICLRHMKGATEMSDKTPTPLERLEKWVLTDPLNRLVTMMVDPPSWSVELNDIETHVTHEGTAPTLDAAILAALAQAEEGR